MVDPSSAATTLITISSIPGFIYYGIAILAGCFLAGWLFNTKLRGVCADNIQTVKDEQTLQLARIVKLETESVNSQTHQKDINTLVNLLTQMQKDFRDGFTEVSRRIDTLLLNTVK